MEIGTTLITEGSVYFIAEAGVNHNGDLDRAEELVEVAADAGADAVKFQTFSADRLVASSTRTADYQEETTGETSQREILRDLELTEAEFEHLQAYARELDIHFLSTPFDRQSAEFLDQLGVPVIKIGSGELTNHPLLERVATLDRPLIVSTGMGTMQEVQDAYEVIHEANPDVDLAMLHCTSAYPTSLSDVNLRAMESMDAALPIPVGYSDHTMEVATPGYAVSAGAHIVEKHITLNQSLPGPDHQASLEPPEFAAAVSMARDAVTARGRPEKRPTAVEGDTMAVARKSVRAAEPIEAGQRFSESVLAIKRPADGLSPKQYGALLGQTASRRYDVGEVIDSTEIDRASTGQT